MRKPTRPMFGPAALGIGLLFCAIATASAEDVKAPYPTMAPIAQYMMASPAEEIALARTAAPASIAADANVMVLGSHGYETAVKGKNGFTCLVERGWAANFDAPVFWNPKNRSPICLNAAAVRSILPAVLERTKWVLAGTTRSVMLERTKAEIAAKKYVMPEPGAMSYMMSKQGYLNDEAGHWHSHVMFWAGNTDGTTWGADADGSPILSDKMIPENITIFFIPVKKWSDGTPD